MSQSAQARDRRDAMLLPIVQQRGLESRAAQVSAKSKSKSVFDKRAPLLLLCNLAGYLQDHAIGSSVRSKLPPKFTLPCDMPQWTISVQCGASFGAGNGGRCRRGFAPRFIFSWPNAKSMVMGDALCARVDAGNTGEDWVAQVCLLKNHATPSMQFCADAAMQILGGMGFVRGTVSEGIDREVKVMMIGGSAEEIMKELAARQSGL